MKFRFENPRPNGLNERADCSVRALAICLATSYDDAHRRLAEVGRKQGRGIHWAKIASQLGFEIVPELSCMTIERLCATATAGRFVIRIRHHCLALVDGVVIDAMNIPPRTRVLMAYRLR